MTRALPPGVAGLAAALLYVGWLAGGGSPPGTAESRPETDDVGATMSPAAPAAAADSLLEEGEELLMQAESRGEPTASQAAILARTAQRLWDIEAYSAALPLAERALAIRRADDPSDRPDLAANLYQVAELHRALGDYAGALRGLGLAADMWEKTLGPWSPQLAAALHYLGVLRFTTGDARSARPLLQRALSIRQAALGKSDPMVAATLMALAGVDDAEERPEAERERLEQALSIWSAAPGADHAHVARCLTGLARLATREGRYAAAEGLLARAYDIRAGAFGAEHYLTARSLVDRAALRAAEGHDADAAELASRALALQRRALGPDHAEVAQTLLLTAECERRLGEPTAAFENALEAERIARRWFRRTARALNDADTRRYESIRTSGLDLALSLVAAGSAPPDSAVEIAEAIFASRALALDEAAAVRRGAADRLAAADEPLLDRVLAALPADAVLVSYVRTGELYLALVFRPARGPVIVPLGQAEVIDARVLAWRSEATVDPRTRLHAEKTCAEAGRRLRAAIWDPIAAAVGPARLVLLVPDGSLNLVNFAALPADDGGYLFERGRSFQDLTAERDLLALGGAPAPGRGLLVVGDPDFEAAPVSDAMDVENTGGKGAGALPACSSFDALDFASLPGTGAEADEVAALWPDRQGVVRLSGAGASENAFVRQAPGRRVLHLATHAFLLPDRCDAVPGSTWSGDERAVTGDRLLLRAGLALAGAAGRKRGVWPQAPSRDGILTSEEIAALDLSGAEWAVLSGCDTGNGTVQYGEGVLGLRRAFQIAGARTVIMSLWSVDDGATRLWMRALYAGRRDGLSTAAAVAAASKTVLEEQRRRGATTHPYFWAAFVAAGDWR